MKDDEGRCTAVVKAFELVEKKSQDLTAKLAKANRDKKSAEVALDVVEQQIGAQHKQLHQAEDELAVARS